MTKVEVDKAVLSSVPNKLDSVVEGALENARKQLKKAQEIFIENKKIKNNVNSIKQIESLIDSTKTVEKAVVHTGTYTSKMISLIEEYEKENKMTDKEMSNFASDLRGNEAALTANTGAITVDSVKSSPWYEKMWNGIKSFTSGTLDLIKDVGATIATIFSSILKSLAKLVETVIDCVAYVGGALVTGGAWLGDLISGTDTHEDIWKAVNGFVSTDWVGNAWDSFYEKTPVGKWICDNSWMDPQGTAANIISGAGEILGVVVIGALCPLAGVAVSGMSAFGTSTEISIQNGDSFGYTLVQGGGSALISVALMNVFGGKVASEMSMIGGKVSTKVSTLMTKVGGTKAGQLIKGVGGKVSTGVRNLFTKIGGTRFGNTVKNVGIKASNNVKKVASRVSRGKVTSKQINYNRGTKTTMKRFANGSGEITRDFVDGSREVVTLSKNGAYKKQIFDASDLAGGKKVSSIASKIKNTFTKSGNANTTGSTGASKASSILTKAGIKKAIKPTVIGGTAIAGVAAVHNKLAGDNGNNKLEPIGDSNDPVEQEKDYTISGDDSNSSDTSKNNTEKNNKKKNSDKKDSSSNKKSSSMYSSSSNSDSDNSSSTKASSKLSSSSKNNSNKSSVKLENITTSQEDVNEIIDDVQPTENDVSSSTIDNSDVNNIIDNDDSSLNNDIPVVDDTPVQTDTSNDVVATPVEDTQPQVSTRPVSNTTTTTAYNSSDSGSSITSNSVVSSPEENVDGETNSNLETITGVSSETEVPEDDVITSAKKVTKTLDVDDDSSSKKNSGNVAIPIGLGVAGAGAAAVAGARYIKNRKAESEGYEENYDDEDNQLGYESGNSDSEYMDDNYLGPSGSTYTDTTGLEEDDITLDEFIPDNNSYTDASDLENDDDDLENDIVFNELNTN